MKKLLLGFLFLLVAVQYATAKEVTEQKKDKIRIAILDLKASSIEERIAKTVSNMLRTDFINTGMFVVIERNQIDSILKEQGFQQTGCTDDECAVEMGRLLSARKMLVGEISKLGSTIIITVRIVDVELGVSEYAVTEKASSEEQLDCAVSNIVKKFTAKIEGRDAGDSEITTSGYYLRGICPGWAQFYTGHYVEGGIFTGAFWGGTAWTIYAIMSYSQSKKDYDNLGADLSQDKYDSAYDKYEKDGKIALYSCIGLGVVYLLNWVDVIFFTAPEEGEPAAMFKYENYYVNINLNPDFTSDGTYGTRLDWSVTMKF